MKNQPFRNIVRRAVFAGLVLTALGHTALEGGSPEPESPVESPKSYLMLRNGQMLEGRIYRVADRYEVVKPTGELHVKASQVLFHCETLEEAYDLRRQMLPSDSAQQHLELAQWCIRSGLFDAARREITAAAELDRMHPWLPMTERRLNMALSPKSPDPAPTKAKPPGPTPQELDRLVRSMPPKTVETFTQSIQPLLVNQCATAGCHGYGSNRGFQLIRGSADAPPTARTTQRNLHSTLQWINLKNPAKSPLLTTPTAPHGSATTSIFADRQMLQYRGLVTWCYRVAQMKAPVVQVSHEEPMEPDASVGSLGRIVNPQARPIASRNSLRPQSESAAGTGSDAGDATSSNAAPSRGVRRGLSTPAGNSADPFDPEAFNRRYAPRPPESEEMSPDGEPAPGGRSSSAASKPLPRESLGPETTSARNRQPTPRVEQRIPAEVDE
jgi:hypothetical protein